MVISTYDSIRLYYASTIVAMMKFTLRLIGILAIIGLGQAHPLLDFGNNLAEVFNKNSALMEEIVDFVELLPIKFLNIIIQYINKDVEVQEAILFMFTCEFHDLLCAVEALKEHQALVVYLEKAELFVIQPIQQLHRAIDVEDYVPSKMESIFKSLFWTQQIGGGMEEMIKDLYDVLPLDKIDALYNEKMRTSKVYADFIAMVSSKEMKKIINDLAAHKTYKEFITKSKEKGLDLERIGKFSARIIGIKP